MMEKDRRTSPARSEGIRAGESVLFPAMCSAVTFSIPFGGVPLFGAGTA